MTRINSTRTRCMGEALEGEWKHFLYTFSAFDKLKLPSFLIFLRRYYFFPMTHFFVGIDCSSTNVTNHDPRVQWWDSHFYKWKLFQKSFQWIFWPILKHILVIRFLKILNKNVSKKELCTAYLWFFDILSRFFDHFFLFTCQILTLWSLLINK